MRRASSASSIGERPVRGRAISHARSAMVVSVDSVAVDVRPYGLLCGFAYTHDTGRRSCRSGELGRHTETLESSDHAWRAVVGSPSSPIMLTSAHLRNYRRLRDLEIPELRRINVFTGSNNSGKTSLLEALFLVNCGANPKDHVDVGMFKDILLAQPTTGVTQNTLWESLLSGLENPREIAIIVQDSLHGLTKLILNPDKSHADVSRSAESQARESSNQGQPYATGSGLQSSSSIDDQISPCDVAGPVTGEIGKYDGLPCSLMFASRAQLYGLGLIKRLESLDIKNQAQSVVSALRLFDPNLRNVCSTFATGQFRHCVDIGLEEPLPLAMFGNGMQSVAQMLISLVTVRDGLLLVDEFENGIHHSLLARVWTAINDVSVSVNAQVITTTHSYECISAIYEALDPEEFRIHRLESTDQGNRCVTYSSDAISGAIQHDFEMR